MDELFGSPFAEDLSGWALPKDNRPHSETITLLRGIAASGALTEQEIRLLAEYLNDSRDARHAWPGNLLFKHLCELFGKGQLADEDCEYLDRVLIEINRQHSEVSESIPEEPELPEGAVKTEDLKLPQIDLEIQVAAEGGRAGYNVNLSKHTCSCPDWHTNRRYFDGGDLKLCCAHMAAAFGEAFEKSQGTAGSRVLQDLFTERVRRARGLDPKSHWKLLKIRLRPHLVSYGAGDWSSVYAFDANMELQRYAYNREEARWSFGIAPTHHQVFVEFLNKVRNKTAVFS